MPSLPVRAGFPKEGPYKTKNHNQLGTAVVASRGSSFPFHLPTLEGSFFDLREKVFDKRRVLREIVRKHGSKNLYDYARGYAQVNVNEPILERQEEFLRVFRDEVAQRLGDDVARSATEQLRKYYFVSTTDHHGPLSHPFFLNANLLSSVPFVEQRDPVLHNVIVLACANVSLNNSSFPRGLLFHSFAKGTSQMHRLAFSSCSSRLCPVYNFPAYTEADMKRVVSTLNEKVRTGDVGHAEGEKLYALLDGIYNTTDALSSRTFSEQITKTNFVLWKKFFNGAHPQIPDLIYLEQEGLVSRLITEYHLDADTVISRAIFDPGYEPLLTQYFEDIMGAFSRNSKYGTYLFWALPQGKKYRVQLWKQGNKLVSDDGLYSVELTPDAIRQALARRELIPSMLLTFMVLSFYYGLKCLGGFSQVNYLTEMKNAYIKMQVDLGGYKNIEVCARAQTKELGGDVTLAFLSEPGGKLIPATGLDLILYGNDKTWPLLVEQSTQITIEQALNPLMPDFYRIIYPEVQRDPTLSRITAEDITRLTQLDTKIKACASLRVA